MDSSGPRPEPGLRQKVEPVLTAIAAALAVFGGIVLIGMALTTVYSIIGRALPPDVPLLDWWVPVRGNFELVEMATGIAIFAFLPYTHMRRGNVLVDFFTMNAPPRMKAGLAIFANLLFSAIVLLFTWRMTVETQDIMTASFTQTTMLLRIPIWYGYLPSTLFMGFLSLVVLFSLWRSIDETFGSGEPLEERR